MTPYKSIYKENDYKGQHTAPDKDSGSPLYDLTLNGTYPNDIYSYKAKDYYNTGSSYDGFTISIIQYYKDKPNKSITIYRAVPDLNKKQNQEIKKLTNILYAQLKYGFFKYDDIVEDLIDKAKEKYKSLENKNYDMYNEILVQGIRDKIGELKSELKKPLKINKGDWVGITKQYAKDHGDSALDDYKIISKKVKAKDIYTNGDSIHEWGYDP